MTIACNPNAGCIDRNTSGILGIESEHAQFYLGNVYDMHYYNATLGAGANSDILIIIPGTLGFVHIGSLDVDVSAGPNLVYLYEGTTVSANGSALPINNLNRVSTNTSLVTMFSGPTVTTVGTQIHFDFMPQGKAQGGSTSGFTYWDHMVLKPNTNYLFRVANGSGAVLALQQHLAWFESTSGII